MLKALKSVPFLATDYRRKSSSFAESIMERGRGSIITRVFDLWSDLYRLFRPLDLRGISINVSYNSRVVAYVRALVLDLSLLPYTIPPLDFVHNCLTHRSGSHD